MNVSIARQPILNRDWENVGYELLYRDASGKTDRNVNGDMATKRVLTNAVTLFDFQDLTRGRAYVNFTPDLILDDFVRKADPAKVVVQITEKFAMDERMETKLRALQEAGYLLVLKNYTGQPRFHHVLNLFDVIRVNFKATNSHFQREAVQKYGTPHTAFMADRLETQDDFYNAFRMGYKLFQGFYYGEPELVSVPLPPLAETAYGKILRAIHQAQSSDLQWDIECARIIERHLLLSYLFLREMKSILSTPPSRTYVREESVAHAARLMGPPGLRRWLWLVYMRHNNITPDDTLPRRAYLRGRFMEELAKNSELDVDVPNGNVFLLGVLSLIEKIAGENPAYLLRGLPRDQSGDAQAYSLLLRYVRWYERQDPTLVLPDIRTSLDKRQIDRIYRMCMEETDTAILRMDTPI
ncbi:MAG: hypothetical protein IJR54_07585 [Oscillibacter sp.]|nr:hypothetical protein [Oscillibacter sp.]